MGSAFGAGAGADALREVLDRKFREQIEQRRANEAQQDRQLRQDDFEIRRQQHARADEDSLALRTQREASTNRINAGLDKADKRATDLERLMTDPAAFDKLTPLQRILSLNGIGVANVGIHDVERPEEHGAHQAGDQNAKFGEWKRQYDYQTNNPRPSRAADPVANTRGRLSMDDPSFPRGVQSYMSQLRTKYQNFDPAQAEFSRALPDLQRAHPSLAPMKALNALRQQYSGGGNRSDDDALLDELLSGDGQGGAGAGQGAPGTISRIRGARVVGSGSGEPSGAAPAAPKGGGSVTTQELQMLAQKRGTSVEQEQQRAAAAGFIIR